MHSYLTNYLPPPSSPHLPPTYHPPTYRPMLNPNPLLRLNIPKASPKPQNPKAPTKAPPNKNLNTG